MTIIFEPLIRTEREMADVIEALRFQQDEVRDLSKYANSSNVRRGLEQKADRLNALIASINGRREKSLEPRRQVIAG